MSLLFSLWLRILDISLLFLGVLLLFSSLLIFCGISLIFFGVSLILFFGISLLFLGISIISLLFSRLFFGTSSGVTNWRVWGMFLGLPSGRGTVYIMRPRGFWPTSTTIPSLLVTSTVLRLNVNVDPCSVNLPNEMRGSTSLVLGNLRHSLASVRSPWKLIISVAVETSLPPLAHVYCDPLPGSSFVIAFVTHG